MTTFRVRCSTCEKILKVPESARGKKVKCSCGHVFRIAAKLPSSGGSKPRPKSQPRSAAPVRAEEQDDVVEDFEEYHEPDDDLDELELLPPRRRSASSGPRPGSGGKKKQKKGGVLAFFTGETAIEKALEEHRSSTGERFDLIKAGMPPLRLWLKNRKGDRWGLVEDRSGKQSWVRYRVRLFSSGPELTFFPG